MNRPVFTLLALLLVTALAGCVSTTGVAGRPAAQLPAAWHAPLPTATGPAATAAVAVPNALMTGHAATAGAANALARWWATFADPVLSQLIDNALAACRTVRYLSLIHI